MSKRRLHPLEPFICSSSKAVNSGSNWLSNSTTAGVRVTPLSSSSLRDSCLIAATNVDTASAEHSAKWRSRRVTVSNLGNKDANSTAPFDVKKQCLIERMHLCGFDTCFKRWQIESVKYSVGEKSRLRKKLSAELKTEKLTLSVNSLTWGRHDSTKSVM